MKIHDIEQGSEKWMQLHVGRPTASEFDNLVTPEFAIKKGEGPRTFLCKKVAEAWRGQPLPHFNTQATEAGLILEEEARPFFELEYGIDVRRVGFIESDDGRCGCSPDGLIGDDSGLEIKCPEAHTHVRYLLGGTLPKEYAAQVYGSMFVTGRASWRFLSYRRKFPPLVVVVNRDEEICAKIGEALAGFYTAFDAAMEQLRNAAK